MLEQVFKRLFSLFIDKLIFFVKVNYLLENL